VLGSCLGPAAPPAPEARVDTGDLQPRCVFFKDLQPFLPRNLPGFSLLHEEGSTGQYGEVQVSEAKRSFQQEPGREVAVRIVDTTMSEDLGHAILAAAKDAKSRAASDPTAPLFLANAVGFVRMERSRGESAESKAEATLWVGEHFVVAVTSRGFEGTAEIRQVAQQLDLAGLAKLRLDAPRRGP